MRKKNRKKIIGNNNWVTQPHVAFHLFYAPFLISQQIDATSDLTACMLVCPRIRYFVLCTRWQKRNIVTMSALNSDNVSRAFDLFLSFSSSLPLSLPPVLGLIFASSRVSVLLQLSLPFPFSSFLTLPPASPYNEPRQRVRYESVVGDDDTRIVLVSKFDITCSRLTFTTAPLVYAQFLLVNFMRAPITRARNCSEVPCKNTQHQTRPVSGPSFKLETTQMRIVYI